MNIKNITPENYKEYFITAKSGDLIVYRDLEIHKIRNEAENNKLSIFYCQPGSIEYDTYGEYTLKVENCNYYLETGDFRELCTEEDFETLTVGQRITCVNENRSRGFRVVGKMPESHNYIIISDGQHLEYIYIPSITNTNRIIKNKRWFSGKYDSKIVGKIIIENLDYKKMLIQEIYIDKK